MADKLYQGMLRKRMHQTRSLPTIWLLAIRPKTFAAAIAPVIVGAALAYRDGHFALVPTLAALLGAIFIQAATNLVNDYADAKKGADEKREGPLRVCQAGLISFRQMRMAIAIVFGLAIGCGVYLTSVGGWPVIVIGLGAILSGIAYTAGPYPLGYHGWGDLFVFIFFGLVAMTGTYYVNALHWSGWSLYLAMPIGFLSVAILVVNNLRDRESDRDAEKMTLVARFGHRFGQIEYGLLIIGAYMVLIPLFARTNYVWAAALPYFSLPLALRLLRSIGATPTPQTYRRSLVETSGLLLGFSLLLAGGLLL